MIWVYWFTFMLIRAFYVLGTIRSTKSHLEENFHIKSYRNKIAWNGLTTNKMSIKSANNNKKVGKEYIDHYLWH